jgi:hypothetical protein
MLLPAAHQGLRWGLAKMDGNAAIVLQLRALATDAAQQAARLAYAYCVQQIQ